MNFLMACLRQLLCALVRDPHILIRSGLEDIVKPALQKKLVSLGAPEAVADQAAAALSIEKFQELKPVLQEMIFKGPENIMDSLKTVFEVLELGDIMEGLVKPALQKKLL